MRAINDICHRCQTYGPIAVLATLGNGRRVALCRVCAGEPGNLRVLVVQLDHAVAPDPARQPLTFPINPGDQPPAA